jgi:hypothetical protein
MSTLRGLQQVCFYEKESRRYLMDRGIIGDMDCQKCGEKMKKDVENWSFRCHKRSLGLDGI